MTEYRYLRGEEWGMRWAKPPVVENLDDPEAYVHHRAGNRGGPDAAAAFRAMNEGAIVNKGYSATDYDFLIHYDKASDVCTIGEARGKWRSAATLDRNEEGEAFCVLGYFHPGHSLSEQPHPAEIEGVARAIAWSIELGYNARDCKILGHRDNPKHPGATGCPGDYLYAHMDTIRRRVAELIAPPQIQQPPEGRTVKYFLLTKSPSTIWQYIDGTLLAVRVDGETAQARQIDLASIPVLSAAEAAKFTFMTGLPSISVR